VAEKTDKRKNKLLLRRRAPQVVKDARVKRAQRRGSEVRTATNYLNVVHGGVAGTGRQAPEVRELLQAKQSIEPRRHGIPRFYLAGLSDVNFTVNGQCQRDAHVASRWTIRAIHSGELMGVPPSGRDLILTGLTLNAVEGELLKLEGFTDRNGNPVEEQWVHWVVEEWNYIDLPRFGAMLRNGAGGATA
jgi:SnoaL-like polyketide cyclase